MGQALNISSKYSILFEMVRISQLGQPIGLECRLSSYYVSLKSKLSLVNKIYLP